MATNAPKPKNYGYPKVFRIPADLRPLREYAVPIISSMRKAHQGRMKN